MNSTPKFWKQWLILVFVLIALAMIFLLGFPQLFDSYYEAYFVDAYGPRLEKQLGFRLKYGSDAFYISAVDKGGVFDRARIKTGFIPVGYRGRASGFYSDLEEARGKKTTLRFKEVPNQLK